MAAPTDPVLSPSVRALAEADFTGIAASFASSRYTVRIPARGILQLMQGGHQRPRLLLSVGIHGDETAPVEMLALLLQALAAEPQALGVDLMVVVGNIAAIAAGRRFIDADMNRMFRNDRGDLQHASEAARADIIMQATAAFFAEPGVQNWHLDLHTAIRPSLYPTFAIIPDADDTAHTQELLGWLGAAGIGAAILGSGSGPACRTPTGTFSAYTNARFGATSATLELGQVAALGSNDLGRFVSVQAALDRFLRSGRVEAEADGMVPHVFEQVQELIKHSEAFHLTCAQPLCNFMTLEPGSLIAQDGDQAYRVGAQTEHLIFPNPDVRVGLRAGLTVVRCA